MKNPLHPRRRSWCVWTLTWPETFWWRGSSAKRCKRRWAPGKAISLDLVLPRTRCIECVVAGVNTTWVRYVYKIRDLLQTQQVSYKKETFLMGSCKIFLRDSGYCVVGSGFWWCQPNESFGTQKPGRMHFDPQVFVRVWGWKTCSKGWIKCSKRPKKCSQLVMSFKGGTLFVLSGPIMPSVANECLNPGSFYCLSIFTQKETRLQCGAPGDHGTERDTRARYPRKRN